MAESFVRAGCGATSECTVLEFDFVRTAFTEISCKQAQASPEPGESWK